MGPEISTFLGPEMATSETIAIWAQKSRDFMDMSFCILYSGEKYVNGSVNLEGHLSKLKTRRDASSGLYLSIYVIIVRQSL